MVKAKKQIDTALVARAESAISIAQEIQDAVNAIVEAGGECDDATMANLHAWQAKLEIKAENIAHVSTRLDFDVEYYKAIEAAAKGKRTAIESAQKRLKSYLKSCMEVAGEKSLKGDLFSISLSAGRASVQIDNEGKLPYEFTAIVELIKPKTAEIKEALERGEVVPGASIIIGDSYITIRKSAGKKDNNDE